MTAVGVKKRKGRRWIPITISLLALAALTAPFVLHRKFAFYTDGLELRQSEEQSEETVREVLWEEPRSLDPAVNDPDMDEYEPRIDPFGEILVFTRGRPGENANLWESRRERGRWSEARPLDAVNTEENELGGAFSADGLWLYFYSDRPGGQGGYDIWVSPRENEGWGTPRPLGPAINSPWNEMSPAPSARGGELYFTSDRKSGEDFVAQPWLGTIRSRLESVDYDIYVGTLVDPAAQTAVRIGPEARALPEYRPAGALMEVNTPAAEGAVAVTPAGDFLYFSSNRPGGEGGFDLYRQRLADHGGEPFEPEVESLGPLVNTGADELDPALTSSGFELYFTRTRNGQEDILVTLSREVYVGVETGEPYWSFTAVLDFLADLLRRIPTTILILLLSLLICLIVLLLMVRRLGSLSLLGRCVLVALLAHLLMAVWMNRNKVHRMLLEAVAIEEDYEFFEVSVDGFPEEEVGFAIRKEESDTGGDRPPTLELTPPSLSSLRERLRERELEERPRQLDAEELLASKAETPPPEPLSRTLPELAAAVETPVEELLPALPEVLEDDALPEVESRPIELQEQEKELRPELASGLRRSEPAPSELKNRAITTEPTRSDVAQLASPREAERPLPRPELRESLAGFEVPLVVLAEEPRDTDSELSFEVLKEKTRPALEDAAVDRSRPERALLASGKSAPRAAKLDLRRRSPGGPSVGLQRSALRPVDSEASERALPTPHAAEAVKVAAAVEAPLPALPEVSEDEDYALPAVETRPVELQEREQEKELRPELASGPRRPEPAPSELKSRAVTVAPTRSDVGQLANPTEAERALPRPELRDAPAGFEEPLAVLPGEPRDTDAELSFAVLKEKTRIASEDATEGRSSAKRALFDSANPAPRAVRLNLRRRSPGGLGFGLQRSSLRPVDSEASERVPPTLGAGEAVKPVATVLAPNTEFAPRPAENDPLPGLTGRPAPSPDGAEPGSDARESRLAGVAPMKSRMNRRSSPASPRRPLRRTTRLPDALERSDKPILPGEGSSEVATSDLKSKLQSLDSPPTSVSTPGVKLALPNKTENSSSFLPRIYQLRTRDRRMEALEKGGGSAATERAVEAGLAWLALHQSPDGRWSLSDYARHIKRPHRRDLHHFKWNSREERSSIGGSKRAEDGDTAATGLALLAFLGHADTHREAGPYQATVRRGLEWLLGAQKPNGDLRGGGNLYMHAVAAFALCEAYAFTRDPDLRGPSQRAINFTAKSQNPRVGGWRYKPYPDSKDVDTSVFGWMLMALKSGMLGRLDVDRRCLVRGAEYLDSVRMSKAGGRYAYQPGITRTSLAMTAQGFFCQTVLVDTLVGKDGHTEPGIERSSRESMDYLLANLPRAEDQEGVNFYYWYYGTLALFQQGGKPWKKWNRTLSRLLIKEQVGKKHGSAYGSWDPRGKRARTGGRVYSTALSILCLEVYYRYAPLKK